MKRLLALGVVSVLAVLAAACSSGPHLASGNAGSGSTTSVTAVPSSKVTAVPSGGTTTVPVGSATTVAGSTQPTTSTTLFGSTNIKGITVFSQQGVGNATTNLFNVPISTTQWDLAWSYDCPGASAGALGSNFVFEVFRDNTKDTKDGGAAGTAATGRGTEHYTDTGAFSIHVGAQSSCVWAFSAILPGS